MAPRLAPKKPLGLDRLLTPGVIRAQPSGKYYGGRDQKAWQEEFRRAREEVSDLEGKVEAGQKHLRSAAGGEWNYSPAGGEATDPEVLKVRAQLRRDRQSLEASRQRLRDLDVEASLAGARDWRKPPELREPSHGSGARAQITRARRFAARTRLRTVR